MDALLREIREGPDGIPEYHDTEISGAELTIGSAPDRHVQLLGRAVALEHAAIRKSGSKLSIECTRGERIHVNGKKVSSATLQRGDTIELSGHQLLIAEPPPGFDVAIELRPNDQVDASEFESAFRTDLLQTWLGKRMMSWIGIGVVLLFGLVLPLIAIKMHRAADAITDAPSQPSPGDRGREETVQGSGHPWATADEFWSSGPLSAAHQQAAGERCDTCHQTLFVQVRDSACQECHTTIEDHVLPARLAMTTLGPTQRCATCHREHNEPATFLVNTSDGMCVDCHAESEHDFGSIKLDAVHGFSAGRHPEFKPQLLKPAVLKSATGVTFEWHSEIVTPGKGKIAEQSNLKFSHQQHLDPDQVLRTGDSQPLNCADCHRLEPDGEHFEPITMETRCVSCHELTFDPAAPDRQLPHGKPREVVLTLQDYFTRKFSDPNAGRIVRERRRLPGMDREEETCTGSPFECAGRAARTEIENQFSRRGCVGCHVVVDTRAEELIDRFQVYPIRFARDYFPRGRFDHRSHQIQGKLTGDAACLSCHEAKDSVDSADLMLPVMAKCEECHGDRPTVQKVTVQCVNCHSYHRMRELGGQGGTLRTRNESNGSASGGS